MFGGVSKIFVIFSVISQLISIGKSLFAAVFNILIEREVKKRQGEIKDAHETLEKADSIEDDEARLKEKADAACKLEKLSNPDADCDK